MGQTKVDLPINEQGEDIARSLISAMEQKLEQHGELDLYDVFCQWDEDTIETPDVELWLRNRSDDSRIGPLDIKTFLDN